MCAVITTSALSVGISGYMAYQGAQDKKNAQQDLNEYERQTLKNAFENIPVNTMATDFMRENTSRDSANYVDMARSGGTRAIFGALPKIQSFNNNANREQQIILDGKIDKRNYAAAGDDQRIREITENRDVANISGLSSQIDAGNQDMWNGISGAAIGAANAGFNYERGMRNQPAEQQGIVTSPSDNYQFSNDLNRPQTGYQPFGTVPRMSEEMNRLSYFQF